MVHVSITFGVVRGSIWDRLRERLGREPTNEEARTEVKRILEESLVERATEGKLKHQR